MAMTSEASSITNFPLRTFNTGCSFFGDTSTREQKTAKKSAAERLTETRGKFVRRGSRDELEKEENRDGSRKVGQVPLTPSHDETQGPVYRAVSIMCVEDGPRPSVKDAVSRPPPPVADKPQQVGQASRKASRDRTLEIVEASLALSFRQNTSSDDDAASLVPPHGVKVAGISPKSNSPQSATDVSGAGSRVRKLREQFLNRGSTTESESDTSQGGVTPSFLQKSDSSSGSPQELRKGRPHNQMKTAHRSYARGQTRSDTQHQNRLQTHPNQASTKTEKDSRQRKEPEMDSEARLAPVASTDALSEQTRRQMERFKARYATDVSGENSLGRKINKIVLKPQSQTEDRKEQSSSADEVSHKSSSSSVRPRSHTSEEESSDQTLGPGRDLFTRPQAPVNVGHQNLSRADKRPNDDTIQGGTYQTDGSSKVIAHNTSRPMTSEEVRRLRRAKEHNVSGKSPERWGDAAETTTKPQRSVVQHAVHHSGDRVVAQVSGKVFPTKHQVSDNAFQTVLQPEATTHKDSSLEVVHRRVKSDLDERSAAKISITAEATSHRPRHRSQDDYLQDPVVQEPRQKVTATSTYLTQAGPSPNTITDFKKKSWAPISFNQSQERADKIKVNTGRGNSSQGERPVSPDSLKSQTTDADSLTPRTHQLHNTPRKIFLPENSHERAKANVQNFLSGIFGSPVSGGEMPVSLRPPLNDGNGNLLTSDVLSSEMPSKLMQDAGNINEMSRPTGDTNEVNSNVYFSSGAEIKPVDVTAGLQAPEDIKLTAVNDQGERLNKKAVGKDTDPERRSRVKNEKNKDNAMTHRMDLPEHAPVESDKRRKFSQKSDITSSKQKVHPGRREEAAPSTEEQRVKKVSLAELLGRDAQEGMTEQSSTADQVRRASKDSKWTAPLKPERSHGDNSETDSDVELQRSKVFRVKRPQRRAENKKEDKSLENLLSRIINPEDDLNTLKRGHKIKPPRDPEAQITRKSGQTLSSSTGDSENEGVMGKTMSSSKKKDEGNAGLKVRRPLLNLNLKRTTISKRLNPHNSYNSRVANHEDPTPQPEPLTSPTRRDFTRQRSKSDLGMSPRCSVSSAQSDVEHFFNQMGLNESFFQKPLSPGFRHSDEEEVFHEMHEYKYHRGDEDGSFSTEHSDNISHGSKVSEEGLHLAKKLPDTSQSIITKNARVIKWLCQMKKARASSIS